MRSHKFSLLWMGHPLEDLREVRGTVMGTERGLAQRDGLPSAIERKLGRSIHALASRASICPTYVAFFLNGEDSQVVIRSQLQLLV